MILKASDKRPHVCIFGRDLPGDPSREIARIYCDRMEKDVETARETARLIVAAVNAIRDAGYTVEELEAGLLKNNRCDLVRCQCRTTTR